MNKKPLAVSTKAEGNVLTLEFNQDFPENAVKQMADYIAEGLVSKLDVMEAKMDNNAEQSAKGINEVRGEVVDVKRTIKSKHISPQDLSALETLVSNKATEYVTKRGGVQTSIDIFLNYDQEAISDMRKLVNKEHGRIKQRIWIELNKDCLNRKGTDPKNRIKDTQVEKAFDFVRRWGGFSI